MFKILLVFRELFSNVFIGVIVFVTILISVFSIGAFIIVGDNFNRYINNNFAKSIPPNTIKVSPQPVPTVGFINLAFRRPPGSVLDEASLIGIGDMPGVRRFDGVMASQIPMQMIISILGLSYRTDLICLGVPFGFVKDDIAKPEYAELWKNWKPGQKVPALIPRIFLEAYNNSMAEPNGLPKISEDFAIGKEFDTLFGMSSLKQIPGYAVEKSLCLGFTEKISSISLVMPLSVVQYYNKKFKGGSADKEYVFAYVEVKDHQSVIPVSDKIKKMGYIVETDKSLAKEIAALKGNVNTVIRLLMGIILVLAVIAISFSTVIATLNRIEYYRVLRILGASKLFITATIFFKYALYGFLASLAGFFLIDFAFNVIVKSVSIPISGFELKLVVSKGLRGQILLIGTLLPVLSTIPGIVRLYTKGMSID